MQHKIDVTFNNAILISRFLSIVCPLTWVKKPMQDLTRNVKNGPRNMTTPIFRVKIAIRMKMWLCIYSVQGILVHL